jgi:FKBP-type peptidyl-prolyl cis-trans isomerase
LLFKLGNVGAVIAGLDDMASNMYVGQRVQAIIPSELAFGDKGICLENKPDECLIKPGSTLVYDIFLKKTTIPPP